MLLELAVSLMLRKAVKRYTSLLVLIQILMITCL